MKNVSQKNLALIITAAIVALVLIIAAIAFTVYAITNDIFFDYTTTDLKNYVTLSKYTGFELNVDIAEPHYETDIEISKINMLCEDKPTDAYIKGSEGAWYINPGDVVYIWYRGCVIVDGEEVWLDTMTNISDTYYNKHESTSLEIGSNGFVPGFELGLVGQKTTDFDDLEIIKEGSVIDLYSEEGQTVAYISYKKGTTEVKQERVDLTLADTEIDAKYGAGFKTMLLGLDIGVKKEEYKTTIGETEVTYTNLTVNIVSKNEDKGLKIEDVYFSYDYGDSTLRNLDAVFYVYFDKIDRYYKDTVEFDEEYLKKKIEDKDIAISIEDLENNYEGETLVDKYDAYARELLEKIHKSEYESAVASAIWNYYSTNAKYDKKELPVSKVDEIYYELVYELIDKYETDGGYLYDDYYGYQYYESLEEYANAYYGIDSYSDYYYYEDGWKYAVLDQAELLVKEKILVFYILREANAIPGAIEFNKRLDEVKQSYVDQYLDQYIEEWFSALGGSKDDYTEAEWEQFKKDRSDDLVAYYGEENFKEKVYYALLSEQMIKWAESEEIKIHTLDTRHNYSTNK